MSESTSPPLANLGPKGRRTLPLIVLALAAVIFGVLFFRVMQPFVLPLFLAATLAMLTSPLHGMLTKRLRGRTGWAAASLTLGALAVIFVPLTAAVVLGVRELYGALGHLNEVARAGGRFALLNPELSPGLASAFGWIYDRTGVEPEELRSWLVKLAADAGAVVYQRTMQFLGDVPGMVVGFFVFVVAYFFFLRDGPRIIQGWEQLTPMDAEHDRVIREEFAKVCRGVVWSTVVAAVAQGFFFGVGLLLTDWIAGVGVGKWTFLLSLLCVAAAMVPLVGSAGAWVPTCIGIYLQDHAVAAIVFAVYCAVVVSNVDTVIRAYVLGDTVNMHPLLVLVSVFGGIDLVGVIGIFVGPIVAAVLIALLRILKKEMLSFIKPEGNDADAASPPAA